MSRNGVRNVLPRLVLTPAEKPRLFGRTVMVDVGAGGQAVLVHDRTQPDYRADTWADCLSDFVRLAGRVESNPESVVRFVRRYGLLGFCQHSPRPGDILPFGHVRSCQQCRAERMEHVREPRCDFGRRCDVCWPPEPVAAWTICTNQARAVLSIAEALRDPERKAIRRQDVWTLYPGKPEYHELLSVAGSTYIWVYVVSFLQTWRGQAPERFQVLRDEKDNVIPLRIGAAADGLLGTLALQLAASITSDMETYLCEECGTGTQRSYRPAVGVVVRCEDCTRKHRAEAARQLRWSRGKAPQRSSRYRPKPTQL